MTSFKSLFHNPKLKLNLAFILLFLIIFLPRISYCSIEEIEATPTNTNGIELGELSLTQLLMVILVFLKLTLLYSVGVLPVEIDLGGTLDQFLRQKRDVNKMETSTYLLDCPLQYVCEVDAWANRDHSDSYLEGLLAYWFKDPDHTWTHPNAKLYSGIGTCKEMYPCPFDVQNAIGITIPGSNSVDGKGPKETDSPDDDTIYKSFTDHSEQTNKIENSETDYGYDLLST